MTEQNDYKQHIYYYCVEVDNSTTTNGYIVGSTNYDVVQQLDTTYNHPNRIHVVCISESNMVEISRFENPKTKKEKT